MVKKKQSGLARLFSSKITRLSGLILLLLAVAFIVLELTNTINVFRSQSVPAVIPTHSPSSLKSSGSQSSSQAGSAGSSSSSTKSTLPSANSSSALLIAPYGDFVSNHNPGAPDQSGNPTPTSETSVCETTPGASCYIRFTNSNGQTTQLPSQTTGSDGSTSWSWDVKKDANLTKGAWRITAVATLSGQTKSTSDSAELTVQ